MKKIFTLVVVCLLALVLPYSPQVSAKEVLKVTRDHFEFRDAPRVDDETFLGTLRIDTPVEWTGNASGQWLEVKAPSGQIGWVHSSGLSRPRTSATQTRKAEPAPAPASSRSVSQPSSSAQVSKLKASIQQLEKAKKQSEAQLVEKDRRIQELSQELEQLEEKLSDTGQMLEDQEQLRTLNERKVGEGEQQLLALEDAIKEKDEALLTAKVENTKLQNQLQNLGAQQGSPMPPERMLLALSLLVNALGFIFLLVMRKRLATANGAVPTEGERIGYDALEAESAMEEEAVVGVEVEPLEYGEDVQEEGPVEHDDRMKELDVVMASPDTEEDVDEELDSSDEVEIDLGDVLPAAVGAAAVAGVAAAASAPSADDELKSEAAPPTVVPDDADIVVLEEPVVDVKDLAEGMTTDVGDEELIPDDELIVESDSEELYADTSVEDALEQLEEAEILEDAAADDELLAELPEEPHEVVELEGASELLESPDEELEEMEELLLEDDELAESLYDGARPEEEVLPEEEVEAVEVGGESFEKFPQSGTQLIESEDEDESTFEDSPERPHQENLYDEEPPSEVSHQEKLPVEESLDEDSEGNGDVEDDMIIGTPGIIDEDDYENDGSGFELSPEAGVAAFEVEEELEDDTPEELPETDELLEESAVPEEEPVEEESYELPDADELLEELAATEAAIAELPEPDDFVEEPVEEIEQAAEPPADDGTDDDEPYEFGEGPQQTAELTEFEVEEIVLIDELEQEGVSKALHDERVEGVYEEAALDISSEVEELLDLEDSSPAMGSGDAPSFLEPSPFLIEPEHEPEDGEVVLEEEAIDDAPQKDLAEEEEGYSIELVDVGENKERVIHVLSKVSGLLSSPNELVEDTPCVIAKGAGKNDAEGFQMIMQKLGAKVRILPAV